MADGDEAATADVAQTHPYTCNSCSVAFRNSDAQRNHMRSDWHRYNLKRRIADLPPVSIDDYNDKVLAAQATNKAAADQAAFVRSCGPCQKTYYSENAYQNHIASKAHRQRLKAAAGDTSSMPSSTAESQPTINSEEMEAEREFEEVVAGIKEASMDDKTTTRPGVVRRPSAPAPDATPPREHPMSPEKAVPVAVPLSRCLFCNYDSPTWKLNVNHMTRIHGLFIPDHTYLVDLEGLLTYLQAKIYQNFECIACHKLRGTLDGVQTHMRDKGHCKIAFETDEEMIEVGQFYDFSSTYSDAEEAGSDADMPDTKATTNGGVKLPKAEGANVEANVDEEGWETDSSFSSLDSAELTSVPIDDRSEAYQRLPLNRHHSHDTPRLHKNADGFHSHAHHHKNAVFYDESEMHLPSGRIAGHRSLRRYYQQNLHSYPSASERIERAQQLLEEGEGEDSQMADAETNTDQPNPRNLALTRRDEAGMVGATTAQRRQVESQEFKGRQKELRSQNRYQAKLEKQANSQKHFRDPLLQ